MFYIFCQLIDKLLKCLRIYCLYNNLVYFLYLLELMFLKFYWISFSILSYLFEWWGYFWDFFLLCLLLNNFFFIELVLMLGMWKLPIFILPFNLLAFNFILLWPVGKHRFLLSFVSRFSFGVAFGTCFWI